MAEYQIQQSPRRNTGGINVPVPSYKQGQWTPTLDFVGDTGDPTYVRNVASFVKIGPVVHMEGHFQLSALNGATGGARILGSPFTKTNDFTRAQGSVVWSNMATAMTNMTVHMTDGSSVIFLYGATTTGATTLAMADAARFQDNSLIWFSLTFFTSEIP